MIAYRQNQLWIEQLTAQQIAERFGTPCYVYSRAALQSAWEQFNAAFSRYPTQIFYAVKANSNLSLLQFLADLGAGFDIVSGGELQRLLAIGVDPQRILFSGVGKTLNEMQQALEANLYCFNVESLSELESLAHLANRLKRQARLSLRLNPDIDARTHPHISTGLKHNKFGIPIADALKLYQICARSPALKLIGVSCHIGSQLTDVAPFGQALARLLTVIDTLAADGLLLEHVNMGGGLGIQHDEETVPAVQDYAETLIKPLLQRSLTLFLEPGRALVGNAGVLLTTVQYLKKEQQPYFAIVDAAMNDFIRPALYNCWHRVLPTIQHLDVEAHAYDVVGPVCESADHFAKARLLSLQPSDVLAICSAGAYGMSMSSNYNSRPRAAEVWVDGDQARCIRRREAMPDLWSDEWPPISPNKILST